MKRLSLIAILIIAVLVLLAGCQKGEVVEQKTTVVEEQEKPVVQETAPKTEIKEVSSEIQTLLDKASEIKSLEYHISVWEKGGEGYYADVYLKGDKMKQVLPLRSGKYERGTRYDTVYIDLAAQTHEAYCEGEKCSEDDKNILVKTDYSDFVTETPFTVLDKVKYGEKTGSVMIESRNTIEITDTFLGSTYKVYAWDYKGVPLKYDVFQSEEKIKSVEYKDLLLNNVKDEALIRIS